MKQVIYVWISVLVLGLFDSCGSSQSPEIEADMVVFGNIYTSESEQMADAFAVKDGKYIFVGSRKEAEKYIKQGVTEVIDHTGKGMVMPGCTDGHANYLATLYVEKYALSLDDIQTKDELLACLTDRISELKAKDPDAENLSIYGFGWNYATFSLNNGKEIPSLAELDEVTGDIPVFLADSEGDKGIANTKCLQQAGVVDEEGYLLIKNVADVVFQKDPVTGKASSLLFSQAATFCRANGLNTSLSEMQWNELVQLAQRRLHSMGYTSAFEGWGNSNGTQAYEFVHNMDKTGQLKMNYAFCYEIDNISPEYVDKELQTAFNLKNQYAGDAHFMADYIHIFMDGMLESGTAYTEKPYSDGTHGILYWNDPDLLSHVVELSNEYGLTMHAHAMGDMAINRLLDAYQHAFDQGHRLRNQIVHARNVLPADFQRMADMDVVASVGCLWHSMPADFSRYLKKNVGIDKEYQKHGYLIQPYFDNGVMMSSCTDAPATSGAPVDPFGIMEIALTGTSVSQGYVTPWDTENCVKNRSDFLQALTLNGAYQMNTEEERGSIKEGKYADFILINQDVLNCDVNMIHETKVLSTYFEGEKVY